MKKLIWLTGFLAFIFVFAFTGFAADDPATVTKDAFNDFKVATELLKQANEMIGNADFNRANAEAAMSLYTRAGQLFERAEGIFKAVGFNYASQQDVNGAASAKESCIKAITQVRHRLNTL